MRFSALALFAGVIALGACAGGDANDAATTDTTTPAVTTPTPGAAATGTAMPATGTTHTVNMVVTPAGEYRYEPAEITVKTGDAIKWVMVSGGPHNVAFQNVTNPAAKAQLDANMPGQKMGELMGPMIMTPVPNTSPCAKRSQEDSNNTRHMDPVTVNFEPDRRN